MKSLGIVVHPEKPEAQSASQRLAELAAGRGIEIVDAETSESFEMIAALGGDGTILKAARQATDRSVPLVGINLGAVGFLSTTDIDHLDQLLDLLASGDFETERRMMLSGRIFDDQRELAWFTALNEIALERGGAPRMITLRLAVGDDKVASYTADGFIVATPTGSTAYSLSAGGPVVEPGVRAMVLTSVAAHSPLWRSIVVGPDRPVILDAPKDRAAVSADGESVGILDPGSRIEIEPNDRDLELVTLKGSPFYEKLRSLFQGLTRQA